MKTRFLLTMLICWLLFALRAALPVSAENCTVGVSHSTIQSAINDIQCDYIFVPEGTYYENIRVNWVALRNLTIQGAGTEYTIIDGSSSGEVVGIEPAPVTITISDITIKNGGQPSVAGGGVINEGNLYLSSTIVASNTASSGAGILNRGVLTLTNSIVSNNYGDGILNQGSMVINDSTVNNNTGYAIENDWLNTLVLNNSTITNNTASSFGSVTNFGTMTLNGSTVASNTAAHGGGIHNQSSTASVETVLILNDSTVRMNHAGLGGGIYNTQATMIVNSSVVTGNASDYDGGGIYSTWGGVVTVTNSIVNDNAAGRSAGGIYLLEGTLALSNSSVSNNIAEQSSGGGILTGGHGTVLAIVSSIVGNNRANEISGVGGGISSGAHTYLTLANSTVSDNAASDGGGLYISGNSSMQLTNSTVSGNTANNGGGIYHDFGTATLNNMTISNNEATNGGGLYHRSGTVSLRNSIIAHNVAPSGPDCYPNLDSEDYNLIQNVTDCTIAGEIANNIYNEEPLLGPLTDNGGPTHTHALLSGSPAIDSGSPALPGSGGSACESTDQRGQSRPQDGDNDSILICDIGAYESVSGADLSISLYLPVIIKGN
jgi:hypothetical protein